MLEWLSENIQENFHSDGSKYNSSSVSQFVEWRSKDKESWVLRVAGNSPKVYVEILDEEKEILFSSLEQIEFTELILCMFLEI